MRAAAARASPEEQDAAWQTFLELLLEAMEACLRDGSWVPGHGLRAKNDRLDFSSERDTKEG